MTDARNKAVDLVTGGAGFVGSHLVDHLVQRGRKVVILDSFDAGLLTNVEHSLPSATLLRADTRDRSWWPKLSSFKIERIFHLAANASVPRSVQDPLYDLGTNIQGTLNLLEFAKEHACQFVFISSAAVYGTPEYYPTDEAHPTVPISHYGVSKLAGEQYVELYRRAYGLDTRTIRYFNSFGPRQPRYIVFDYLRKAFEAGNTFEVLGSGQQVRTQMYVSDTVEATRLIAERGDHRPYNVGSERAYSVLELAHKVLEITGRTHKAIRTSGSSWPGDISVLQPNTERLKALGFTPRYTLDEGLQEVLAWWQQKSVSVS